MRLGIRTGSALLGAAALCIAIGLALAANASAEGSDTPAPTDDIECFTYYPSTYPTDGITVLPTGDTGVATGIASGSAAPPGTAVVSDTGVAIDTGVPSDSAPPSDIVSATDTGGATDVPSGPYTACVGAEQAGGGAVDGPATATAPVNDPIANTGNDTRRYLVIAALLIVLGSFAGLLGSRFPRADRSH